MITPAQRTKFFPLMAAAWSLHLDQTGQPDNHEQKEAWYREQISIACADAGLGEGIRSIKDVDPVAGYDAVMLHFAILAEDHRAAGYFAVAAERRYRKIIGDLIKTIAKLENRHLDWSYARGIYDHMELPLTIDECPVDMLQKVLQALDTQRRRILAARGQLDTRKPGLGSKRYNTEYHMRPARDFT